MYEEKKFDDARLWQASMLGIGCNSPNGNPVIDQNLLYLV